MKAVDLETKMNGRRRSERTYATSSAISFELTPSGSRYLFPCLLKKASLPVHSGPSDRTTTPTATGIAERHGYLRERAGDCGASATHPVHIPYPASSHITYGGEASLSTENTTRKWIAAGGTATAAIVAALAYFLPLKASTEPPN